MTPADGSATVSYDADVRLRGPLSLLDPLMSKGFQTVAGRAAAAAVDAALEVTVVGSFSKIGLAAHNCLLPEFTVGQLVGRYPAARPGRSTSGGDVSALDQYRGEAGPARN